MNINESLTILLATNDCHLPMQGSSWSWIGCMFGSKTLSLSVVLPRICQKRVRNPGPRHRKLLLQLSSDVEAEEVLEPWPWPPLP